MRVTLYWIATNPLRRALIAVLALVCTLYYPYALARQSPLELVQDTAKRLLDAVEAERDVIREEPQRLQALVDEILLPVVDEERISRWVLGRHWRQATPEQLEHFRQELKTLLIRTYAAPLTDYIDVEITYFPVRIDPDDTDAVVRTRIRPRDGEPVLVTYRLHYRDETWKVYDVIIGGVSAVTTYRSMFSDQIQRHGLEGFIDRLADANRRRKRAPDVDTGFDIFDFDTR